MANVATTAPLEDIRRLVRRIVEQFHPQRVILFGSYARGEATRNSDVDLLVVKETNENPMHLAGLMSAALDHSLPVDIVVMTPQDLEEYRQERAVFATQILKDGLVLYEASDRGMD